MIKQKEAVYQAVVNVMGAQDGAYEPTDEQKASINQIVFEGLCAGKVEYSKSNRSEEAFKKYAPGLVNNWLRKDTRLTGGDKYVPKNPGSRAGSKDPSIKAMRVLLSTKTGSTERAEIQAHIDRRLAEIKPTKQVELNVDALPEELRHLVSE